MSNIQIYNKPALPPELAAKLTPREQSIVMYAAEDDDNPKYLDAHDMQKKSMLANMLLKVSIKLGTARLEGRELGETIAQIDDDLGCNFKNLRLKEILAAIDAGLNGDFLGEKDTRVFFSISNMMIWIKKWIEVTKIPAMKKAGELSSLIKEPEPEAPSEKTLWIEKYKIFIRAVADRIDGNVDYIDAGEYLYSFMVKFNLIEPVKKEFVEMIAITELNKAKNDLDRTKINEAQRFIDILKGTENFSDLGMTSVATRAAVTNKINFTAAMAYQDILDYLDSIEVDMKAYFQENNL